MDDQWSKLEQLMSAALAEMKEAQRFAAIGTNEAMQISLKHASNAGLYLKMINSELVLSNEQERPDLSST